MPRAREAVPKGAGAEAANAAWLCSPGFLCGEKLSACPEGWGRHPGGAEGSGLGLC